MLHGYDISHHQKYADIDKLSADFVIIRIGYGTTLDTYFEEYANCMLDKGIPFGIYLYSRAYNTGGINDEINFILNQLNMMNLSPQLPIYIDLEEPQHKSSLGHELALYFCETMKKYGYYPGVYAGADMMKRYIYQADLTPYSLWIARYFNDQPEPYADEYLGSFDVYQYSSKGILKGQLFEKNGVIKEHKVYVDKNVATDNYITKFSSPAPVINHSEEKVEDTKMVTIQRGSKGASVKVWQIIVGTTPDGIFGKDTLVKTRTFQNNHHLVVDGIVGKNSWKAGLTSLN